jgi:outer membrane lipoprotein-sorting protein
MFMLTAASNRAGRYFAPRLAPTRRGSLLLVAFAATAAIALPAGAQTAQDVLKKVESIYGKATSFQGSVTIKQSGKGQDKKPASVTRTQTIKYKSPNLFRMQVVATGTGAAKAQAPNANSTIVSDGKTLFAYSVARKQYAKQPVPPNLPLRQLLGFAIPTPTTPGVKMLPAMAVLGRQAFVLEITPTMPPNLTPEQKAQFAKFKPLKLMVDKQNYHILQLRQSTTESTTEVNLGAQTFNSSIPGNTFVFTPPAGVTEFIPPANPPGGGVPGLPGGGPPR